MATTGTQMVESRTERPVAEEPEAARPAYLPLVDVAETDAEYRIAVDLPGVAERDIEITLNRDVLMLRARSARPERPGYEPALRQIRRGEYRRTFALPEGIDREHVRAHFHNGVLRLTIPKAPASRPRRIEVHAAA